MVYMIHSRSLHLLIQGQEYGNLGQSSRQARATSWCAASLFGLWSDLGTVISVQFLVVLRGVHLVLESQEEKIRVVSFDMHLLVVVWDVAGE